MQAAQNVSQVLLGLNLKCTSCHDSFISDWKLDDAYAFANVFSSKTLEIHRCDLPTGRMAGYGVLYNSLGKIKETNFTAERLVSLADILVQKKNGRLYRTLVNRVWAQLMGRGIVEPVDMMDNEPLSEEGTIAEIERYMAIPAQALSYKIGALKIREIRERLTKEMGPKFKLSDFHDALLKDGNMPLDVLESKMNTRTATIKKRN